MWNADVNMNLPPLPISEVVYQYTSVIAGKNLALEKSCGKRTCPC